MERRDQDAQEATGGFHCGSIHSHTSSGLCRRLRGTGCALEAALRLCTQHFLHPWPWRLLRVTKIREGLGIFPFPPTLRSLAAGPRVPAAPPGGRRPSASAGKRRPCLARVGGTDLSWRRERFSTLVDLLRGNLGIHCAHL